MQMSLNSEDTRSLSRGPLLMAGLSLVLLIAAFWGGLDNVFARWMSEEEYSHGFFIPLIAVWLVWLRRDAVVASIGRSSWASPVLLLVALALLLVGELSAIFILIQLGFVLALVGLVLGVGGGRLLRVVWVAIAYLLFAIPMPYFLDAQLTWQLQLWSSQLGVALLRLFGVTVLLQGNVIDLGVYKLQVVEACSGLNYLFPLLSLGFLAAYFFRAPFWQRALVFLSTIPITVVMNSLRIATIGVLVDRWGTDMAEGVLHFFEGWVVFMACALLLVGEIWLFARVSGRRLTEVLAPPAVQPSAATATHPGRRGPLAAVLALSAAGAVAMTMISDREEIYPERQRLAGFPRVLEGWRGEDHRLDMALERHLGVDDYLLVDYRSETVEGLGNVYVAYYASQRKGVSPHSPRVCLPGGGWAITELERSQPVSVPGGPTFPVNRALIERGEDRQLVYYWFEQRGRRVANEYLMKWYLLVDAILMNRTDGALVRLTTPLRRGESIESAEARLQDLLTQVVPRLPEYLPH
jgi:exosortase D (VPLPA-CTERM-specific)